MARKKTTTDNTGSKQKRKVSGGRVAKKGVKDKAKLKKAATKLQASTSQTKDVKKAKGKKGQTVSLEDLPTTPPKGSWMYQLLNDPGWKEKLVPCFHTEKFKEMEPWVEKQYKKSQVFPPKELIFNAFNLTPLDEVKVVILGQDPYHDDGQAVGLSFSVPKGIPIPPSLKNIYKELKNDHPGFTIPDHGCLESWAKQGVLLLNAALTVEAHQPNSHARCGWWEFTDNVIRTISNHGNKTIFILWGGFAHKKEGLIDASKHAVIKTAHPSPLSFNKFNNCKCFSRANNELKKFGRSPIDWNVE